MALRTRAAVLAGKLARAAARQSGRGGTALPGLVAERLDPGVVATLGRQLDRVILITGTNGKTTTARMVATMLAAAERPVVHNRAGSNLSRGIAAALIESASVAGRLPAGSMGVFEVDEAALPGLARALPPDVVTFANLMRDQLDRYGEIDRVRAGWETALRALGPRATVVLNADDPLVATLADAAPGAVRTFGVEDALPGEADDVAEAVWDPRTGADYQYDRRFFAHLGHWRSAAGACRPAPDVAALEVDPNAAAGALFTARSGTASARVRLQVTGLYNVYNALAALTVAQTLGIGLDTAAAALAGLPPVFGRQEHLLVNGHPVRVILGKNPAGMNQALRTLRQPDARHHLLILLNDRDADGTDVSWIWDTDWERLQDHGASLVVGGTRAADMALRLRYAGLPEPAAVVQDIGGALARALAGLPPGAELVVLATYTAMLDVRQRLGGLSGVPMWEVA